MPDQSSPAVVPPGERADLQQTARETGERMGRQDTVIAGHDKHLGEINGAITKMADKSAVMSELLAVVSATLSSIQRTLDTKLLSHESRLTVLEAWVAEQRGGKGVSRRMKDRSLLWWLAVFGAVVTLVGVAVGAFFSLVIALVVLIANGQIG